VGNAVIALHQGFDYQARWFWIEGLRLFRSEPVLERVAIEAPAPRGFDDIVSYPVRPRDQDVWGRLVGMDGFQAKFHTAQSRLIRAADLSDPEFIGAKTSLLERLRAATVAATGESRNGRFTLVTPWRVDRSDLLGRMLSSAGELRMSLLFDGKGRRSDSGKLRAAWREHLGLGDDDALQNLLRHFRILERDVEQTNRELERELEVAGLVPVQAGSVTHPYVDLIHGHVKLGELEFDAARLRQSLTAAGLWRAAAPLTEAGRPVAIRSRRNGVVHLEDETSELLDLIPLFHDRELASGIDWDGDIAAQISRFLRGSIQVGEGYRLYLDAHTSIAFAVGWLLHRADITPMQNVGGRLLAWPAAGPVREGPLWHWREQAVGSGGPDVALALSVAQDVEADVLPFVVRTLPQVGKVFVLTMPTIGRASVRDGAHANALASEAVEVVRRHRPRDGRPSRVHIFAAAPNGLVFQLGRNGRPLGPTTVYEFDFDNPHLGYSRAISTPIQEVSQ
jgi:SMODS-associated and fused to various effectors sensor domain